MEPPTSPTPRALVIAGGPAATPPPPGPYDLVIAADGGYDHALRLDVRVDMIVGDLDSISDAARAHAEEAGVAIHRSPTDKDESDLELALRAAARGGCVAIDLVGAEDGRIDHLLTAALGLTATAWEHLAITWWTTLARTHPLTGGRSVMLTDPPGTGVTLVPVGDATAVSATGMRWPLDGATLPRGTSRGLSNEITHTPASVSVGGGGLLVIVERTPES